MWILYDCGSECRKKTPILIKCYLLSSAQTVEGDCRAGKRPTRPSCLHGDAQRVAEQLWMWPLCPKKGQQFSRHILCSHLFLHPSTVFRVLDCVVWRTAGYQTLLAVKKWDSASHAWYVLGGGRMSSAREQLSSTRWEGGEHWDESQLYSKSQSCHWEKSKSPWKSEILTALKRMSIVSTKNHLLSCFMFCKRNNRSEDGFEHVAFLIPAVLKVAKLASFFSKTSFFGERRGQKERSGTSKILPESLRVFPLHLWPLAAFLWDKYLTSLLVRFSSQFIQSIHINIYPSSQAVKRCACASKLDGSCYHDRHLFHATFTELWAQFKLWCSWWVFDVNPEPNSSGPWQGMQYWNPAAKSKTL